MNQRLHVVNGSARHWSMEEEGCPTCKTGKGYGCIDMNDTTTSLPKNTVHVARIRANGHNVRM